MKERGLKATVGGFFTRHLGTKFLSLLLAAVLFVFVRQTLQGRKVLRKLTLNFELTSELRDRFVLPEKRITLNDLEIGGLGSVVEREFARLNRVSEVEVTIDRRMLQVYGDPDADHYIRIFIDRNFFRDHEFVLGEGIRVTLELTNTPTLNVAPRQTETVAVELADPSAAELDPESTWLLEGAVTFDPPIVTLTGPRGRLPPRIEVAIPDLDRWLRDNRGRVKESPEANRVAARPDVSKLQGLVALKPDIGDATKLVVYAQFRVRQKPASLKLEVPIRYQYHPEKIPNLAQYEWEADLGFNSLSYQDYQQGVCRELEVRAPKSLAESEDLGALRIVLDFSAVSLDEETIEVPVFLQVTPPDHPRAEELRRVTLQPVPGEEEPRVRFRKKKPE